jgi:hypothetical protein
MVTVNTGQVAPAGVLPHFVASLGSDGSSLAHMITGSSSIYNPTSTGFTVYIRQQTCGEIDGTAGGTQRHAGCSSTDATAAITPLTATLANQALSYNLDGRRRQLRRRGRLKYRGHHPLGAVLLAPR